MATTELDTLLIKIAADTAGLRGEMAKANAAVAKSMVAMQKEAQKTNAAFEKIGGAIKSSIMGAIGALSLTRLIGATKEALKFADALEDQSKWLGISAERLQVWQYAARLAGVDQERLVAALDKMKGKIAEAAADPKSEGANILRQLGLSPKDLLDLDAGLLKLADKIKDLGTGDKLVVGKALFGDKMDQFVQLLEKGSGHFKDMDKEARALGQVLANDVVARGAKLNDEFDTLTKKIGNEVKQGLIDIGPVLLDLLGIVGRITSGIAAWGRESRDAAKFFRDTKLPDEFIKGLPKGLQDEIRRREAEIQRSAPPNLRGAMGEPTNPTFTDFTGKPKSTPDRIKTGASSGAADAEKLAKKLLELRQAGAELRVELEKGPSGAAWEKFRQDLIAIPGGLAKVNEAQKQFNDNLGTKGQIAVKAFADENDRLVQITAAEAQGNRELVAVLEARFALEDKLGQKLNENQAAQIEGLARTRFKIDENRQQIQALHSGITGALESGASQMTDAFEAFFDKNRNGWEEMGNAAISTLKAIAHEMLMVLAIRPLAQEGANWLGLLLSGAGAAASGAFGGISGGVGTDTVQGFASGGSFRVGGRGGTDTTPVGFWATRGEEVTVRTPGQIQRGGMGGGVTYIDARGADPAGLARVEAELRAQRQAIRRVDMSIEDRAVGATIDMRRRGGSGANTFG